MVHVFSSMARPPENSDFAANPQMTNRAPSGALSTLRPSEAGASAGSTVGGPLTTS
jgi:hypothetical protein